MMIIATATATQYSLLLLLLDSDRLTLTWYSQSASYPVIQLAEITFIHVCMSSQWELYNYVISGQHNLWQLLQLSKLLLHYTEAMANAKSGRFCLTKKLLFFASIAYNRRNWSKQDERQIKGGQSLLTATAAATCYVTTLCVCVCVNLVFISFIPISSTAKHLPLSAPSLPFIVSPLSLSHCLSLSLPLPISHQLSLPVTVVHWASFGKLTAFHSRSRQTMNLNLNAHTNTDNLWPCCWLEIDRALNWAKVSSIYCGQSTKTNPSKYCLLSCFSLDTTTISPSKTAKTSGQRLPVATMAGCCK